MKSLIASLRSLTLPFGATSGPRIVLNGVLGRIEVYADDGTLLMTLDDDGFVVYDPQGDIRQILGSTTSFSTHVFFDSDGGFASILGYEAIPGSDDYRAAFWQSPDTDLDFSRLFLLSPKGSTTKNPLLQWDTGFLDSTVAQPIVDFTGFTGALAARTVVNDLWHGVSNGGGNAPTVDTSYPRGVLARVRRTSNVVFSTETQVHQLPAVTLEADRRYRLGFSWRSMSWNTTAAAVIVALRIKDLASTQRAETSLLLDGATGRAGGVCETIIDCPGEIGSGSHTFEATATRVTGAGTDNLEASGTTPSVLYVEDVGSSL
jgi:hypothetical protein